MICRGCVRLCASPWTTSGRSSISSERNVDVPPPVDLVLLRGSHRGPRRPAHVSPFAESCSGRIEKQAQGNRVVSSRRVSGTSSTRFYGWYSNRTRGFRQQRGLLGDARPRASIPERDGQASLEARRSWARLIRRLSEVDPLVCSCCGGRVKLVSVIGRPADRWPLDHGDPPHRGPAAGAEGRVPRIDRADKAGCQPLPAAKARPQAPGGAR
jgi:hypothetical protein